MGATGRREQALASPGEPETDRIACWKSASRRGRALPHPWFALILATAGVACEDTHVLSGSFRSDVFVARDDAAVNAQDAGDADRGEGVPAPTSLAAAFQDLSLELVLGHFGPEVAGLAKFRKVRGAGTCPCAQIRDGRYGGGQFDFSFVADFTSDCLALGSLRFRASLSLRADGALDGDEAGYLDVTIPGSPDATERLRVVLGRDKREEDLNALDLSCEGFSRGEGGRASPIRESP